MKIIEVLRIDERQKELYRQSVEILNDAQVDGLYATLIESMKKFEQAEVVAKFSRQSTELSGLRKKEIEARIREDHSADILLDNI